MNRSNDKKLRDFILEQCYIDAVISLPLNTFFTTNKKTYILALTKKTPAIIGGVPTLERQTTPVFTYLCSEIGETRDVNRFDIEQNDLEVSSDLFNMFKGARTKFKSSDKRCKIVSVDDFLFWSILVCRSLVDKGRKKIELGIEDDIETVDLEGYLSMVAEAAQVLQEFDEPLRELVKKKSTVKNSVDISLSDSSFFELSIGKKSAKKDYIVPKGNIPVYSANVFVPFVYSDSSNITDWSKPYVIWGN